MKRIITAVAVIFLMAATSFSQTTTTTAKKIDNDKWLDSFETLVTHMQAVDADNVSSDSITQWRSERANFRAEYRTLYKDSLSDSQEQRYFSLKAKYNKALTKFRLNDAGTHLSDVGDKASDIAGSVKDKAKKVGNKLSGWFKGLKK